MGRERRSSGSKMTVEARPNFFIVGAPKCGTTSLAAWLSKHPQVFVTDPKEPFRYGSDLESKPSWHYREAERYARLFAGSGGYVRRGEATVWYLYSERAAQEIAAEHPDARIVMLLRKPVDAVQSLHAHFLTNGNERVRSLERAIDLQGERASGARLPKDAHFPAGLQYTRVYDYPDQIRRYLDCFGTEAVHVVLFEELKAEPVRVYDEVCRFLGINTGFRPNMTRKNAGWQPRSLALAAFLRSAPPWWRATPWRLRNPLEHALERANRVRRGNAAMTTELRRRLEQQFAPVVAETASILGRDLGAWIAPEAGSGSGHPAAASPAQPVRAAP